MIFRIHCPRCRSPFDVDENLVGEKGLCPSCQERFIITRPATPDGRTTQPMNPSEAEVFAPKRAVGLPLTMAILLGAGFLYVFWWAFKTYPLGTGMKAPKEFTTPGRLHPMILHLPIGFLFGALVLEMFTGKKQRHASAVTWLLWLSFLSAAVAALAGYFWAAGKSTLDEELERHLWTGLAVPAGALLTLGLNIIANGSADRSAWPYRIALLLTLGVLNLAGHIGGKMVHGDPVGAVIDMIAGKAGDKGGGDQSATPNGSESGTGETGAGSGSNGANNGNGGANSTGNTTPAAGTGQTFYQTVIAPIIKARCVSCHGDEKQKGDLRMDTLEAMLAKGESGNAAVVPGKSAESHALHLMKLPLDDDEHMPPDNKPQPAADEVAVFEWWINAGAKADVAMDDASIPADIRTKGSAAAAAATRAP